MTRTEDYWARRAAGRCIEPYCRARASNGFVRCQRHHRAAKKSSAASFLRRYQRRKVTGLCVVCGGATGDTVACKTCQGRIIARQRAYLATERGRATRRAWKAEILRAAQLREVCVHCSRPAVTTRVCDQHRDSQNRKRRERWRAAVGRLTKQTRCGTCGLPGHNARTCHGLPLPSVAEYATARQEWS